MPAFDSYREACQNTSYMEVTLKNLRVVAVDGGTATGKGRLIEELASLMRMKGVPVIHLSTGSIYRGVAYVAIEEARQMVLGVADLAPDQLARKALEFVKDMPAEKLLGLARERNIEMHGGEVWIDGAAALVDEQLKGPGVGTGASIVGDIIEVRHFVNEVTRRQINEFDGFALVDGRDIGHEVVPDAPLKLLLTVDPKVAAERSREHTLEEIVARDTRDRARPFGALKHQDDPGEGVIVLPTDGHSPESARDHVYGLMRRLFVGLGEL
jgi:cytidylate kinase